MKLNKDNDTLAQDKILVLYLLNKIKKPISINELLKITTSIKQINYFYLKQFLLDLEKLEYIISYTKNDLIVYEITENGIYNLELLEDLLPGIVKLKADTKAKEIFDKTEKELSISAEYFPEGENKYIVKCKITENYSSLLELSIFAGSSTQAKKIAENWKNDYLNIYPQIIELLTKENNSKKDSI